MRVSTVYKHVKGLFIYNNGLVELYGKELHESIPILELSIDAHANIAPSENYIGISFPTPAVCQLFKEGLLECKKST